MAAPPKKPRVQARPGPGTAKVPPARRGGGRPPGGGKAAPKLYEQVLDQHRAQLRRLTEARGVARVKKLYDQAAAEMGRRVAAVARPGASYTAHVHKLVLAQLRQGQAQMSQQMAGELGDLSREAQAEAVQGLAESIGVMEQRHRGVEVILPIEEAARFAGVIDKRRTSLLRMHGESMARYGAAVVGKVEQRLALSLAMAEDAGEVAHAVAKTIDGEFWQAERITRTEIAWAYGAASHDAFEAAREALPDLRMRWSEHVDDATGEPMDDRVGVDSLAMHGQVAPAGGLFTMPPSAPDGQLVSLSLVGKRWAWTPCRPNGREVLAPWRRDWGVPGWEWRGSRVAL